MGSCPLRSPFSLSLAAAPDNVHRMLATPCDNIRNAIRKPGVLCLLLCLAWCSACSRQSLKERAKRATNKAGQVVGEGAGSFFTGVGAGVEKTITSYDVRLSDELKRLGVTVTIAKHAEASATNNGQHGLSFYILNKAPVAGTLVIRLFNDDRQEIGRAAAPVDFKADDARYTPFTLDKEIPISLTRYVELDLKRD